MRRHFTLPHATRRSGTATATVLLTIATALALVGHPALAASAPLVKSDRYAGVEDRAIVVRAPGVLRNDPARHARESLVVSREPRHGTVELRRNGSFVYRPDADWSGTDTFRYRLTTTSPGRPRSDAATVTLVVRPVDDRSIVVDDSSTTLEDTSVSGQVLTNDSDVDSTLAIASYDATSAHGSFALDPDGAWTYLPDPDWSGTYTTTTTGPTATLTITVLPVNYAPVAVADAYTGAEDGVVSGNVLFNDSDIDGDHLTADLVTGPANGSLTLEPNGTFLFTPDANWNGTTSFTYRARDSHGALSSPVSATITIA